jgi:ribosomal protein S18 acetylase RimI-like enzyme
MTSARGSAEPGVGSEVTIVRGDVGRLADLESLYVELHDHHVAVAPRLAGLEPRTAARSWALRQVSYAEWLARPGAQVLVAEREDRPAGYLLASTTGGYQSWASGDRVGEVHDLVVAAGARGQGIGGALMDTIERHFAGLGIREYRLMLVAANEPALRFYEARGMTLVSQQLLGHIDGG